MDAAATPQAGSGPGTEVRTVRTERRAPGVAYVTLDAPRTRNALSDGLLDELAGALESAAGDAAVRVIVLASSSRTVFSAGGDLRAFAADTSTIEKYRALDRFPRLFTLLMGIPKPVVCAAGGDVLAGAFGLALACDMIVARRGVRFGCPEINVGVFPFMISALIFRNLSRMKANQLMMMGESITADEALHLGVVNAVVDDAEFDDTVLAWAQRLAEKSPLLLALGKSGLNATRDLGVEQSLEALRSQLALALSTEDVREGVAAFREKRPPRWAQR